MKFYGAILAEYDISENTTIGIELYNVASSDEVKLFLEVGTQYGGSARCISSGLLNSGGHLHTIEAIKDRVEKSKINLKDLPVTCHWSSTGNSKDLKRYYNRHQNSIQQEDDVLKQLLNDYEFDAVFLDSCIATQQMELELCVSNKIKHILMHEPDQKCPNFKQYLSNNGYTEISKGRDKIKGHNPLWVRYSCE